MLLRLSQRPCSSTGRHQSPWVHCPYRGQHGNDQPVYPASKSLSPGPLQESHSLLHTQLTRWEQRMGECSGEGKVRTPPRLTLWNRTRGHMALKTILSAFWSNESKLLTEGWSRQMEPESYTVSFKLMLLLTGRNQCTVY